MYGKFFASTFTGSMVGAGAQVFAVWGFCIANACNGQVELNSKYLAPIIGCSVSEIEKAIEYLCSPDPASRSKELDGRRLIKVGQFAYDLPNFFTYRGIRNEEDRREQNRAAQQKHRDKHKPPSANVSHCQPRQPPSAHAETETETETEKEKKEEKKVADAPHSSFFNPPEILEIKFQCGKIGLPELEGEKFQNFYACKGWMVGKSKMKDWRRALQNWKIRWDENRANSGRPRNDPKI